MFVSVVVLITQSSVILYYQEDLADSSLPPSAG